MGAVPAGRDAACFRPGQSLLPPAPGSVLGDIPTAAWPLGRGHCMGAARNTSSLLCSVRTWSSPTAIELQPGLCWRGPQSSPSCSSLPAAGSWGSMSCGVPSNTNHDMILLSLSALPGSLHVTKEPGSVSLARLGPCTSGFLSEKQEF